MFKKIPVIFMVLSIVLLSGLDAFAQTRGNISGTVKDASTKEALYGANVILKGTSMGGSTDFDGLYSVKNVPAGSYTMVVSYLGYKQREFDVKVKPGENLVHDFNLEPVSIQGQEVVVTAQAGGQYSAINQQLTSDKIVNVVSAARIQELPDANAAESVGRLPGVSVTRDGGEATGVVVRGLEPKYNMIMIDGVEMASTSQDNRSSNLSMISSNSLSGIEVYKTLTPDMDAAVLGGVVNFKIKEADKANTNDIMKLNLLAQGGYNGIVNKYNNFKFVATAENRFLDDNLGVFAQGILERVDRTNDQLSGNYSFYDGGTALPSYAYMTGITLNFVPRQQERFDGTLTLDYLLPDGKIDLMNFFSKGTTNTTTYQQRYALEGNSTYYKDLYSTDKLNTITNLLSYKQTLASISVDVKLSHSFSENVSPNDWDINFWDNANNINKIDPKLDPIDIARQADLKTSINDMVLYQFNVSDQYTKQQNVSGQIDLERTFTLSDWITAILKAGGSYKYTYRWHSEANGGGNLYNVGETEMRQAIIARYPWMMEAPYNLPADGQKQLPMGVFLSPGFDYGTFLDNKYKMGPGTDINLLNSAIEICKQRSIDLNWDWTKLTSGRDYTPDNLSLIEGNYHGIERRNAFYFMATINVGPVLTIIPGVRYQGLETSYYAPRIYNPNFNQHYPVPYPHIDTTMTEYHGYWLPDLNIIYRPETWLSLRAAYTTTLSYPDFSQITPLIQIGTGSVTWHNYALSPAKSQNFDASFSIYDNNIGLFSAGGFLKRIDGLIFGTGARYPQKDWSAFPGVPQNYPGLAGLSINYSINNPYRTDVWGIEAEWQTHFWYLPAPLNGLVMNVNYTHVFSGAKYPYTYGVKLPGYPPKTVYVDTFYTDRLYQQPNDIVNLSIGYDYKGFSILTSMIYQANVFNGNNFHEEMRSDKDKYLRWDIQARQKLPWYGLEVFGSVNNLNDESDINIIKGAGFPTSAQDYGMTAAFGLRCNL